jgi:hypothetical protein
MWNADVVEWEITLYAVRVVELFDTPSQICRAQQVDLESENPSIQTNGIGKYLECPATSTV